MYFCASGGENMINKTSIEAIMVSSVVAAWMFVTLQPQRVVGQVSSSNVNQTLAQAQQSGSQNSTSAQTNNDLRDAPSAGPAPSVQPQSSMARPVPTVPDDLVSQDVDASSTHMLSFYNLWIVIGSFGLLCALFYLWTSGGGKTEDQNR
jgi:hypothetical protein